MPPPPPPLTSVPASKPPQLNQGAAKDRNALLNDISKFKGAKLKKVVTNDRSAPTLAAKKDPGSGGRNTGGGMGGLFAGGIPQLKKTNPSSTGPLMPPGKSSKAPPIFNISTQRGPVCASESEEKFPPPPMRSEHVGQQFSTAGHAHFRASGDVGPINNQPGHAIPPPPPPNANKPSATSHSIEHQHGNYNVSFPGKTGPPLPGRNFGTLPPPPSLPLSNMGGTFASSKRNIDIQLSSACRINEPPTLEVGTSHKSKVPPTRSTPSSPRAQRSSKPGPPPPPIRSGRPLPMPQTRNLSNLSSFNTQPQPSLIMPNSKPPPTSIISHSSISQGNFPPPPLNLSTTISSGPESFDNLPPPPILSISSESFSNNPPLPPPPTCVDSDSGRNPPPPPPPRFDVAPSTRNSNIIANSISKVEAADDFESRFQFRHHLPDPEPHNPQLKTYPSRNPRNKGHNHRRVPTSQPPPPPIRA